MDIPMLRFDSGKPGKRLVVFGAIHGNEPCGPRAIERVAARMRNKDIALAAGSILFVPGANPKAFELNVRQTEENLNRVFKKSSDPRSYEARVANELCALLDAEADILLDIHSTSAPGPMSIFVDYPSEKTMPYADALGPEYIILDWPLVYENNPHGFTSSCTSDYAHEIGIPGITVECGQHADPASIDTAERAILRACAYAGILRGDEVAASRPKHIRMRTLEQKKAAEDVFAKHWQHLEGISKGDLIAILASGEEVIAEEDCVMILPKHHALAGEEWYYLGVIE